MSLNPEIVKESNNSPFVRLGIAQAKEGSGQISFIGMLKRMNAAATLITREINEVKECRATRLCSII